jgi:hypothetical protein
MVGSGLDFFFGLWQEREDLGHGQDFDEGKKLAGEVRKSLRVESAGADFGEQIGAEHFAAIGQIDGDCHKSGAMLVLDGRELRSEFVAKNEC